MYKRVILYRPITYVLGHFVISLKTGNVTVPNISFVVSLQSFPVNSRLAPR